MEGLFSSTLTGIKKTKPGSLVAHTALDRIFVYAHISGTQWDMYDYTHWTPTSSQLTETTNKINLKWLFRP